MRSVIILCWGALIMSGGNSFAQEGFGIGNTDPQELLDVSGRIKIGGSTIGSADAGTIRWNGTNFQGYNGSTWLNLDEGELATSVTGTNSASSFWGNQTLTGTSWTDIISIYIPEPGRYLILTDMILLNDVGSSGCSASFRLTNSISGPIANSESQSIFNSGDVIWPSNSRSVVNVSAAPCYIRLQGRRVVGTTVIRNGSYGSTKISYIKLSD